MRSFANLFNPPSPEKIAARELQNMRLTLFQAERRLLEAQMQVDYYRDLVSFLEDVSATGVEQVVDKRRASTEAPATTGVPARQAMPVVPEVMRSAPGLTTVPSAA